MPDPSVRTEERLCLTPHKPPQQRHVLIYFTYTLQLRDLLLLLLLQLQVSLLVVIECPAELFSLFPVVFLKVSMLFL